MPAKTPRETSGQDRRARLRAASRSQEGRCLWCGQEFGPLVEATRDHVVPRAKGGPSWSENEVAACRRCNAERGHQGPVAWFEECCRRGWAPDAAVLAAVLGSLGEAIARRGGQRRARPYLAAQQRRLAGLRGTDGR